MKDFNDFFKIAISKKIDDGSYRKFLPLVRVAGESPIALTRNKEVTVWCSNDYLGMSQTPSVINTISDAVKYTGTGAGGTRNIAGTSNEINNLENEIARFIGKESSLVFSSGYIANQTAISALSKLIPDCLFISDEMNHASMIDGIKLGKANYKIFKHNSLTDLEEILQKTSAEFNKILLIESVYSMDGDIAPLKELISVAKKYNCLVYVDETHAVGLYGSKGSGVIEREGLTDTVDFIQGGFGKAVGVVGGFIAGNALAIDAIRSYGNGFIFTTALPPYVCAGIRASIKYIQENPKLRQDFFQNVEYVRNELGSFPLMANNSHILPMIFGSNRSCNFASQYLLEKYQIYLQPINYPTVRKGTERFRITPNTTHSRTDVAKFKSALNELFEILKSGTQVSLCDNS